jgi:hypothetical protein
MSRRVDVPAAVRGAWRRWGGRFVAVVACFGSGILGGSGCAGRPSARITQEKLDGPRPTQVLVRCLADGLKPPVRIAWQMQRDVKQIGWGVPSEDEPALLVQVPDREGGAWVSCVAFDARGNFAKAARSVIAPSVASAPAKVKPGDVVTLRGAGFGPARGADDAVFVVPPWGATTRLDHACKQAAWNDGVIVACAPPSLATGNYELRVQAGGSLARAPAPIVVAR